MVPIVTSIDVIVKIAIIARKNWNWECKWSTSFDNDKIF